MVDNKQYITQAQENGTVMISEDVIATIVTHAVKDVEGVVEISTKPGNDLSDLFGKMGWGKGIEITVAEDNSVVINCNLIISYGQSVVTVASAVQTAVSAALEAMTGVNVAAVNVNVCGIIRQ